MHYRLCIQLIWLRLNHGYNTVVSAVCMHVLYPLGAVSCIALYMYMYVCNRAFIGMCIISAHSQSLTPVPVCVHCTKPVQMLNWSTVHQLFRGIIYLFPSMHWQCVNCKWLCCAFVWGGGGGGGNWVYGWGFLMPYQHTYSPISHNQWTQVGTGQTPVGASHLRAILIQRLS